MNYVEPIRKKEDVKAVESYLMKRGLAYGVIFAIGVNTGLRVSDILALNVRDVKGKNKVTIREKKTKKYKQFPLNSKLLFLLNLYLQTKSIDEPLFVGDRYKRMCRSQVYKVINKACRYVGLDVAVGTHTMRKTFGYHHYKQFNDIALLQKILNHSSPAITLRYIGVEQDEINLSYSNFEL